MSKPFSTLLVVVAVGVLSTSTLSFAQTGSSSQPYLTTSQVKQGRPSYPPPKGSRGDAICVISPVTENGSVMVWSDRPVFLWDGEGSRLELREMGSTTVLWSQDLAAAQEQLAYGGQPLQPGTFYEWRVLPRATQTAASSEAARTEWHLFGVLGGADREAIATDLQNLEARLRREGANASTILRQTVDYFLAKGMPSDAIGLIYQTPNASADWIQADRQTIQTICPPR